MFSGYWRDSATKDGDITALAVPPDLRKNTVVVTDSPNLIKNWQLKFDAQQHLEEVIRIYQASYRGGLVEFENSITRYNPEHSSGAQN